MSITRVAVYISLSSIQSRAPRRAAAAGAPRIAGISLAAHTSYEVNQIELNWIGIELIEWVWIEHIESICIPYNDTRVTKL